VSSTKAPFEIQQSSTAEAEALIREARKRQRRRHLVAGAVAVVVLGVVVANSVLGGARHPSAPKRPAVAHPRPAVRPVAGRIAGRPGPTNSTVLMWPVGSGQDGTIYLDNLRTGRLGWATPVVDPGEFQPVMVVDRRIVYVTGNGVSATGALTGRTLLLGKAFAFAPSATPAHIWLDDGTGVVRSVSVVSALRGPSIVLPPRTRLIAGMADGLLLAAGNRLELSRSGSPPRTLPGSVGASAFAVSSRLVAYETGCADHGISPNLNDGGYVYYACSTLRVFDVVTGRLRSFPAPPGTSGWVPSHGDYWSASAISPSGALLAAKAVIPPDGNGISREFVLRLSGSDRATAVPFSAAFLLSVTAWSPDSAWLFYQGPGERMWAYQARTGKVRSSRTRCCQYAAMATFK
jgi:hypothetical protein